MPKHKLERPTTHVSGAILFFGAVSFDVVITGLEFGQFEGKASWP